MGTTGQPGHRYETDSTTAHANRWPHTRTTDRSNFDDDHRSGNMQDLHRPCPPQMTIERLDSLHCQLRLQSNKASHERALRTRQEDPTTEARAAAQASLDAIIIAKQKSTPPK